MVCVWCACGVCVCVRSGCAQRANLPPPDRSGRRENVTCVCMCVGFGVYVLFEVSVWCVCVCV